MACLKCLMMNSKRMFFMSVTFLTVGIIIVSYILDPSGTARRIKKEQSLNRLPSTVRGVAGVEVIQNFVMHSNNSLSAHPANKTLHVEIKSNKSLPVIKAPEQKKLQGNKPAEVQMLPIKVPHFPEYVEKGSKKAAPDNDTDPFVKEWTLNHIEVKGMNLSYARYQLLKAIACSPPPKDQFTEQEDALFTNPTVQSPWMLQFQPPEPLPTSSNVCQKQTPFLLVLILSVPSNRLARVSIRHTWGSVAQSNTWPHLTLNAKVKILFVMGREEVNPSMAGMVEREQLMYNDILLLNLVEDYNKLTMKMLASLKWVHANCSGVKFLLKADEDSFINIPLIVDYLLVKKKDLQISIIGFVYNSPFVWRDGKWRLSYTEYPFKRFPAYASGSSYIISSDAIGRLLNMSKYFVPIPIEDAFITGILAKAAGVRRLHSPAMAVLGDVYWGRGFPQMCEFYESRFAITDCTAEMFDRMWLAALINYCSTQNHSGFDTIGKKRN